MPDVTFDQRDRIAIRELTASYNRLFDAGDADRWVETFVPHGELVAGDDTYAGHEELAGFCAERGGQFHHLTTDPEIDAMGDRAAQRCSLLLYSTVDDDVALVGIGRYLDELVRTPTGWRFLRRTVHLNRARKRSFS